MDEAIEKARAQEHLSRAEAEAAMEEILAGGATDEQIRALLVALREKGETVEELVGFARAMRRHATPIFPAGVADGWMLVDTCGTGGDAAGTFNVSTCAAFVAAGAGVRVAKHGNRSISSRCGSADVLEALGVRLDLPPAGIAAAIERVGIGFLFAPALHTAMRHAMAARRAIGGRTVFNLLGPLTNPAGARAQVLGVFAADRVELMAQALAELGAARAFVVHGEDGLDEITLSGKTQVAEVHNGAVKAYAVTPEEFGLRRAPREALAGGDAAHNADLIRRVLGGDRGPRRDIVVANAAAALVAAGASPNFREAAGLAAASLDSGAASAKLQEFAVFAATRKHWKPEFV
jgi:anthranilate phosphoribosyltransferase